MKHFLKKYAFLFLFSAVLPALVPVTAGESVPFLFGRADFGWVMPTNVFVRGMNLAGEPINRFGLFGAGLGWQTSGKRDWEQIYHFPSYGAAAYSFSANNSKELGAPIIISGFFEAPFRRWERSSLTYFISAGAALGWNKYDSISNPYNMATGSRNTLYIGFGAKYHYQFALQWEVAAGVNLSHFSNGALRRPNRGVNLISPDVTLRYYVKPLEKPVSHSVAPFCKTDELFISLGGGVKTADRVPYDLFENPNINFYYGAAALTTAYMRQYSHRSKSGLGLGLMYDAWLGSRILKDAEGNAYSVLGNASDRFSLNLFAAHELCVDRLSFFAQVGYYVWQAVPEKPSKLNQRIGVKYHFANDLFVSASIFAHKFSLADYIEWGVGYRFRWGR